MLVFMFHYFQLNKFQIRMYRVHKMLRLNSHNIILSLWLYDTYCDDKKIIDYKIYKHCKM